MSKLLKKTFTVSVVALTIMWSVGIAALIPTVVNAVDCPTLVAGDFVMVNDKSSTAVWVLDSGLKKIYFPNEDVYKTWSATTAGKADWSLIKKVAPSCLENYNMAAAGAVQGVNFFPGSTVLKLEGGTKYFVTLAGNMKSEISEVAATELFGTNWKNAVKTYSMYFSTWATDGTKIETPKLPDGWLVKKNVGDVYQVVAGKLSKVDGTLTGAAAKNVRTVSDTLFATVEVATTTVTPASVTANPVQTNSTTVAPPATTGGNLTVSLSADTPASTYVMASAARVPFTKVTFTAGSADVTIDQFKVKRTGVAAVDADFSTINVVTPEGNLLNDSGKTPNSDHEVTFTEDIVIPAGTSKTYTLVGDMAAAATLVSGNVPKLALTAVISNAAAVTGLPVEGNAMTTNESLTLGTVTLAQGNTIGTVTKQVATNNVNFMNLKITNTGSTDTKSVKVEKVVLYNAGTVADADVTNYKLKYNGNVVANGTMANKYLTFDLSACTDDCTIAKGYDRTYEVYGDLTGGSGRTVEFYVYAATHVLVKDVNNGIYLTPTNSAANANINDIINVSQGKLNVTKTLDVPTGNVSGNASNVALASFNYKVTGEPIDVRKTVFKITTTGTLVPTGIDSIVLYDKGGKALTGSVDGTGSTGATGFATSSDTFTLQPGDNLLTVQATIDSTAVAADTIKIDIDMRNTSNFIARGVNSALDITLGTYATPEALVQGPTKTVATSALTVTTLATPAASTYAPGVNDIVFSRVMFDASASSEDIKVTQFLSKDAVTTGLSIDIQNIRLFVDKDGDSYNGTGTPVALGEVLNGTSSAAGTDEVFTFNLSGDDQFIIKAGKKLIVEVKGNIVSGATAGSHQFSTNLANDVTATGQTTKNTVTETIVTTVSGPIMTVGAAGGQLEVALASDAPTSKLFAAGTTATLAAFRFLSTTTEDVELDYVYLTQVVTVTASSSYNDYDEIWFEDGAGNEIAGTRMSPTSTVPLVDFSTDAFVVKTTDGGKILYLKGKLAAIGSGANGVAAHQLGYKIAADADVVAKGDLSGSTSVEWLSVSSAPTGNTHFVYKAYPVVAKKSVETSKLANGTRDLFKFQVSAVNGDIALNGFTFDITTTTAVVAPNTLYLYDVTNTNDEKAVNETGGSATFNVWQTVGYGNDWDTTFTADEITVSVNQPKTFILRGNVSGSTTGAAVSVGLAGDSASIINLVSTNTNMGTATVVNATSQNDFIWSDKNNDSHTVSTADWTNGYLVSGLASNTSTLETVAY